MSARLLLRLALYRPAPLAAALFLWVGVSLLPLASGFAVKALFDKLAPDAPAGSEVWLLVALVAVLELAAEPLSVVWIYAHLSFENVLELLVRRNLFHRALTEGRLAVGVGDAVTRFRGDADGAIAPINEWYRMVGEAAFTVAAVVVMASIHPAITAIALTPTAAAVLLLNRTRSILHSYTLATRKTAGVVGGFLGDALSNVMSTKAGGAEDRVVTHFDELSDTRRQAAVKSSVLNEILTSASGNVSLIARALVLLLATRAMARQEFTVGDFALFSLYMEWVFEFPRRVGRVLASHRVSTVSTERLTAMTPGTTPAALVAHHDIAPASPAGTVRARPPKGDADRLESLALQDLTAVHPGSTAGVEDVSLVIERGEFVVVTGRTGAGKTALLRAALGLMPRSTGEVRWNGALVEWLGPPRAAFVSQTPILFAEPLRDNLVLGADIPEREVADAIERSALTRDLLQLERGIDTDVGPAGARLSGGQLLRASLARALLHRPELLVIDDVSAALDVATEQELWQRLRTPDLTILTASTRRHTLSVADRIVVLDHGRVTANGKLEELLQESTVLQGMWADG